MTSEMFSAKVGREICGGAPTDAPIVRVRDVVLCLGTADQVAPEEFRAHPPIAGAVERRNSPGTAGGTDLGRGLRIDRLSSGEEKLVMTACDPRGHYFFPIRHNIVRHVLILDVDSGWEERLYHWDPDGVLFRTLTLSRLVRDNGYSLNYAARLVDYEDGEQMVVYLAPSEGKAAYRLRTTRDWLDAQDGAELRALLSTFWDMEPELTSRLGRAMWRMEYASWLGWADLALLMLVSGLEALLKTERHRATQQFKTRVSALARDLAIDGVDQDFCERIYDARSEWPHGAHVRMFLPPNEADGGLGGTVVVPVTEEELQVLADVALVQDVLRGAVRRCIEDKDFRAIFLDDQNIRGRWPVTS